MTSNKTFREYFLGYRRGDHRELHSPVDVEFPVDQLRYHSNAGHLHGFYGVTITLSVPVGSAAVLNALPISVRG